MSSWIFTIFSTVVILVVLVAAKKGNRISSFPEAISYSPNGRLLCRNFYVDENCIENDFLNLSPIEKLNYLFNIDGSAYDAVGDDMNQMDLENPTIITNDMQSNEKRGSARTASPGCSCEIKNHYKDLGPNHFPRHLRHSICHQDDEEQNPHINNCWNGSKCVPLNYNVRVLTNRSGLDLNEKNSDLPISLRNYWIFKTVTVAAGCFCQK